MTVVNLIDQVQAAIAANVQRAFPELTVTPYMNPTPDPPCVDMMPDPGAYNIDMGGDAKFSICVRVMVAWNDSQSAQSNLNAFIDPTGDGSLKKAIEVVDGEQGQCTLGGLVAWARVIGWSGYKEYPHRQSQVANIQQKLGVEFTVQIQT